MPSAYKVPMASDVLPDPDTPTTATVRHNGTSASTSRRLLCRAPRTLIAVGRLSGTGRSAVAICCLPKQDGAPPPGPAVAGPGARAVMRVSGVDRSAWALVQAERLHDLERRGVGELLDVRGRQHAGVLGDDRRGRTLGHGVQVTLHPGPEVLPALHVVRHWVDARECLT